MSTNTAWGRATVKERVEIPQAGAEKEFVSVIELLEGEEGASMLRFAYTTDGKARRGPVTFRAADLAKLRTALTKKPELAAALAAAIPR